MMCQVFHSFTYLTCMYDINNFNYMLYDCHTKLKARFTKYICFSFRLTPTESHFVLSFRLLNQLNENSVNFMISSFRVLAVC